jgi:hypothetical protein
MHSAFTMYKNFTEYALLNVGVTYEIPDDNNLIPSIHQPKP